MVKRTAKFKEYSLVIVYFNAFVLTCGKAATGLERILCRVLIKELQVNMDRRNGCCDITEILLKMALKTIQSISMILL